MHTYRNTTKSENNTHQGGFLLTKTSMNLDDEQLLCIISYFMKVSKVNKSRILHFVTFMNRDIFKVIKASTQGMLQFIGLGYVGPKQEGW